MSEEETSTDNNTAQSQSTTNGDVNDTTAIANKSKKLKPKKTIQKESTEENESDTQNEKAKVSKTTKKNESSRKNRKNETVEDENDENESGSKRVPLLDQNPIVDGPRNRRTVVNLEPTIKSIKSSGINIPNGKGTPLGRIPIVNTRMKRLTIDEIKRFHRFLFGKLGKVEFLRTNMQRFTGFPFEKDSDQYVKKLAALNKYNVHLLKEYQFFLDLDLKIKKKEDISKAILEFLLKPYKTENSVNPAVVTHPKRKATKRNYYEKDFEEDRKVKKKKPSKAVKDKESPGDEDGKKKTTKTKEKDENANANNAEETTNTTKDNAQELTKPAKKRKRNQVIDEAVEDKVNEVKTKKIAESEETKSNSEISDKKTLTDEELKEFLKKVLADANLEKTTMKTVYNLINTHYPNYNFASKKDLIKEIVKSLIQS